MPPVFESCQGDQKRMFHHPTGSCPVGVHLCISMLLGLALASPSYAACEDPATVVRNAESDIESFYLADAERYTDQAIEAFGCSPAADPLLLARLWQARGMVLYLQGNDATLELAASKALNAEGWNKNYGAKPQAVFDGASVGGSGGVRLKGAHANDWIAIDGRKNADTKSLTAGPHLLQVGRSDVAYYAKAINVLDGDTITIAVPEDLRPEAIPIEATVAVVESATPMTEATLKSSRNTRTYIAAGTGTGALAVGVVSIVSLVKAMGAYGDYTDEPYDNVAAAIYENEVKPPRSVAAISGGIAVGLAGTSAVLFATGGQPVAGGQIRFGWRF